MDGSRHRQLPLGSRYLLPRPVGGTVERWDGRIVDGGPERVPVHDQPVAPATTKRNRATSTTHWNFNSIRSASIYKILRVWAYVFFSHT